MQTITVDGATITPTPAGVDVRVGDDPPRLIPWADILALPAAYAITCDGWLVRCVPTYREAADRVSDLRATGAVAQVIRLAKPITL